MLDNKFFSTLFQADEGICYGSFYATDVYNKYPETEFEFFCLNPLSLYYDYGKFDSEGEISTVPRRADINVTAFRSFMFEIDCLPLEDQVKIFDGCGIPFTTMTFSGGKSYHAILSLQVPMDVEYHTSGSSLHFKQIWRRLSGKIDRYARSLGYEYPEGTNTFIDKACNNPSRLTRFPGFLRDNGNYQSLLYVMDKISSDDFDALLSTCPIVRETAYVSNKSNGDVVTESVEDFWKNCPVGLYNDLKYVTWAAPSNCYHELYRVTRWAIRETNVDYDIFVKVLDVHTFDKLLEAGYPYDKLTVGVKHAFEAARREGDV